jgi:hypothetical protein
MKRSGNQKFEEEWRQAFEGAEVAPHESVWTAIDLKLSHAESGSMKRRVIFYQRLAAASILFALCLGATGVWYLAAKKENIQLAQLASKNNATRTKKNNEQNLNRSEKVKKTENSIAPASTRRPKKENTEPTSKTSSANGWMAATNQQSTIAVAKSTQLNSNEKSNGKPTTLPTRNRWRDVTLSKKIDLLSSLSVKGKPISQIERTRKFKQIPKEKNTIESEDWWASLNGSSGVYNQTSTSNSFATTAFNNSTSATLKTTPISNQANAGLSYSFGMSVGKKVAKRLVLMTGISYLNQSIDYNSNIVLLDASNQARAFLTDVASESTTLASTTTYIIKNTSEFISFPLQAGYLIMDRKAGIQLNAGIAADLFYRNTIADQSGRINSYSESAGENSAYRSLNWTGLIGTELSYRMNSHYHIAFVPGLRYSFNSVLKSSTGSTISPLVWDVGFRFKYIF